MPDSDLITRKEKQIAHVDWLSFTVPGAEPKFLDLLEQELCSLLGIGINEISEASSGWNGYKRRLNLGPKAEFGLIAYGGSAQRGSVHVSLSAHACNRIPDWKKLAAWGPANLARIARIDLAHDDLEGEAVNIGVAMEWLYAEAFSSNGRPPSRKLVDDLGSGAGSTLYIGSRKNGKVARLYEKGKQLGDPNSPWFRVEVEWRGKDRVIPWTALTDPDPLLAGAYPCFEILSARQDKIATAKKASAMTVDRMRKWVRTAAGPSIHALAMVSHGDIVSVFDQVCGDHPPRHLIDLDRYLPPHPGGGKGSERAH